jgi:methionine synthase / methylenetetrahydrofolate reductase(NADPH)
VAVCCGYTLSPDVLGERLRQQVLVCDGAMGTMLHAGGVSLDRSLPELNVSRPDLVQAIHRAYIAAGAQVIETNTFGASRFRLARHGLEDRVAELNVAGVRAARRAQRDAGADSLLVAGSMGPATPAGLGPRLSVRDLRLAFRQQIAALLETGIDLLVLETFGSLPELVEAVGVALELGDSRVPIVAQMTFVDDGRTLGGDTPEEVAATLEALGVSAVGANCTLGPQGLLDILGGLARATALPLSAQPNAGPPTLADGHFRYTADPSYFARHARRFVDLGASLVGGCCGTTPAHIQAVAAAVAGLQPVVREAPAPLVKSRRPVAAGGAPDPQTTSSVLASGEFIVACELPPPGGGDAERAVADARMLQVAGCSALVVPPVASPRAQVSPASIASLVQQRVPGLGTILTATTWEKSLLVLEADLLGAHAFGIRHIVCRTGTPPLQADYPNAEGVWDVDSVGLIEVLKGLNTGHDHNGIPLGRPTSFVIGARVNPSASDFAREVADARRKVAAGASFLLTPPVFDLEALDRLLDALDTPSVPVLVGLMPLHDLRHAEYLQHEVPEMSLPDRLLERMCQAGENGPAVGREIACELAVKTRSGGRVRGLVLSSANGSATELATLLEALQAG